MTSAASEFTNALKKLEAKGKIDLGGRDVERFSQRLADVFSKKGINGKKLAKAVSHMLDSLQGNSFANAIEKGATNKNEKSDTDRTENTVKTDNPFAPKNAVAAVAADGAQAIAKIAVTEAPLPQAPTALTGGFDGSSLGLLQQAPQAPSIADGTPKSDSFVKLAEQPDANAKAKEKDDDDDKSVKANGNGNGNGQAIGVGNDKPAKVKEEKVGNGQNLSGNNDDELFDLAVRLFSVANERVNEKANTALGAQNRGNLSGANLIALQASDGKAGGNQAKTEQLDAAARTDEAGETANLTDIRGRGESEAEQLAARLAEANSRLDAQSDAAEVTQAAADDKPVATEMAAITSTILEEADMVEDADAQKIELSETLMNALKDVREQKEHSEEKKQEQIGGLESLAA